MSIKFTSNQQNPGFPPQKDYEKTMGPKVSAMALFELRLHRLHLGHRAGGPGGQRRHGRREAQGGGGMDLVRKGRSCHILSDTCIIILYIIFYNIYIYKLLYDLICSVVV